jgi:hypothetical protein
MVLICELLNYLPWTLTPARRCHTHLLTHAAILASSLYTPWPNTIVFDFGASYLHFRYGRQFAIPLASYSLLPPCMQSSVLVCWLGFDQVGLTNLPTSAFVAHLQLLYNQKANISPFSKMPDS